MINKRATEIYEFIKKNEDYEKVNLSDEQNNFIYSKIAEIKESYPANDEEKLWNKVEEILHTVLIELGYDWDENNYKWVMTILV